MIVYQLHIDPGENDSDGEDFDEYFSSIQAAKKRRKQLIEDDPEMKDCRYDSDYKIDKLTLSTRLSPRQLILAVLNRKGYVATRETVVEKYQAKRGRGRCPCGSNSPHADHHDPDCPNHK